jgi:hypothetical protein
MQIHSTTPHFNAEAILHMQINDAIQSVTNHFRIKLISYIPALLEKIQERIAKEDLDIMANISY